MGSHRAVDLESFQFGEPVVPRRDPAGEDRQKSRYFLHVQCPWRIVVGGSIVVGDGDISEPDGAVGDSSDFDPNEIGTTLRDERLAAFYGREIRPRRVLDLAASELADLRVNLDGDCVLEVFTHLSAEGREYWRFHRCPGWAPRGRRWWRRVPPVAAM